MNTKTIPAIGLALGVLVLANYAAAANGFGMGYGRKVISSAKASNNGWIVTTGKVVYQQDGKNGEDADAWVTCTLHADGKAIILTVEKVHGEFDLKWDVRDHRSGQFEVAVWARVERKDDGSEQVADKITSTTGDFPRR